MSNLQQTADTRHASAPPLVLVADGDSDTRFLLRAVLEMRGYCVIETADGEETVGPARSARPDLILMDGPKTASCRYLDLQKGVQMSVSLMTAQELLGLFELDAAGKVLYYRMDSAGEPSGTSPNIVGRNFYNEVAGFENVEEFRRCVTEFTLSDTAADSFDFECRYGDFAQRIKVLLARICESVNRNNTKSVLVYLKRKEH